MPSPQATIDVEDDEDDTPAGVGFDSMSSVNSPFGLDAEQDVEDSEEDEEAGGFGFRSGRPAYRFVPNSFELRPSPDPTKDETYWINRYQKTKKAEDLEPLMVMHKGLIDQQIARAGTRRLPWPYVRGQVYTEFARAVERYDPDKYAEDKKASFTTAWTSSAPKNLEREYKKYAQFTTSARDRLAKIDQIKTTQELLELSGDEVTAERIAAETGIAASDVRKALAESTRDLLDSQDLGKGTRDSYDARLTAAAHRVKDEFTGAKRQLTIRLLGLDGRPSEQSNKVLMQEFGLSDVQISIHKKAVRERLQAEMRRG
jgi:DNA-directed RNA polymerase specialized sigma subunit